MVNAAFDGTDKIACIGWTLMQINAAGRPRALVVRLDARQKAANMADTIDPVELARAIADIASTTNDPNTARRLIALAEALLRDIGLPRTDGGEQWAPPSSRH